ncbi:hypothetical protein OS493_030206 [Desmophyllum pertusum]|uniref:Uncharacterized protein n=1 Tax=Desmophyllum pertusum TaxID=174260 RepID=A0A9W9YN73_9CNID|nr:hypothetical protein OS493_030206 [Desmophyllum pertusum]
MSKAKKLKGYLLLEFQANLKTNSECATHCASLWLSDDPPCGNISQHQETCQSCLEIFHLIREIKECSNYSNDPQIADEVITRSLRPLVITRAEEIPFRGLENPKIPRGGRPHNSWAPCCKVKLDT